MEKLRSNDIIKIIEIMCETVDRKKDYLSELDANVGDGDFGSTLSLGFEQVQIVLPSLAEKNMEVIFKKCGSAIIEHCGGCTGPIWGGAFRTAGNCVKGKEEISLPDLSNMLSSIVEYIKKLGGADLGDKTLLDALIPAARSLESSVEKGVDLKTAVQEAALAAKMGAEGTVNIIAQKGRAKALGERALGYPDPGAVAVACMFMEISKKMFA